MISAENLWLTRHVCNSCSVQTCKEVQVWGMWEDSAKPCPLCDVHFNTETPVHQEWFYTSRWYWLKSLGFCSNFKLQLNIVVIRFILPNWPECHALSIADLCNSWCQEISQRNKGLIGNQLTERLVRNICNDYSSKVVHYLTVVQNREIAGLFSPGVSQGSSKEA